ncbi:MAG: biotin--[acetyl-CoA-carboxylase] ligase [Chloroflexota bacterium]
MIEGDLSSASITDGLETGFIGQRVLYYSSVTSTMDVARRAAQKKAPEGTVVIADEQTLGRGRIKRAWLTPPGSSIAMSLILYPAVAYLPYLIMVASLSVLRGIKSTTGLQPQIKWPNDVLIDGKKVCGILIENAVRGNTVDYAIIGIGINVNLNVADFPEIAAVATSLSRELGADVSRPGIVRGVLVEMEKLYRALGQENDVFQEWRDNLVTLGKRVRVSADSFVHDGIAESVSPDGSLHLRTQDGSLIRVLAEDVTLRA